MNTQLGRERAAMTTAYYDELQKQPDIDQLWQDFQANGGRSTSGGSV